MVWTLLLVSLALNVVFLLRRLWGRDPEPEHEHTWTPWTEFTRQESPPFTYGGLVYFRRVRYCTLCAQEEVQKVGKHACEAVAAHGKHCPHMEDYTAVFDPLYDLKQLEQEIRRLDGDL